VDKTAWEKLEVENIEHQRRLRNCVTAVCGYFNLQGGFTYIGWKRMGLSQDVSDANNTNVASDTQVPHICYLFPTRENLVHDQNNQEYRNLMLTVQKLNAVEVENNEE
jgi:hypothetical protein